MTLVLLNKEDDVLMYLKENLLVQVYIEFAWPLGVICAGNPQISPPSLSGEAEAFFPLSFSVAHSE